MISYTETRLREVSAILSAVVLIVEDGDAEVTPEACRELAKIVGYCERIGARAEKEIA